ncbi:MAG: hypothetical protein IPJ81_04325 [Chitinophagaceae bacterium]|nr:hypothetical protein [Chitinophagaceae bacterium]
MSIIFAYLLLLGINLSNNSHKGFTIRMHPLDKITDNEVILKNEFSTDSLIKMTIKNLPEAVELSYKISNDSLFQKVENDEWNFTELKRSDINVSKINDFDFKSSFKNQIKSTIKKNAQGMFEIKLDIDDMKNELPVITLEFDK